MKYLTESTLLQTQSKQTQFSAQLFSTLFHYCQSISAAGVFTNPLLFADFADPDVIRVQNDFYMAATSFHMFPGAPVSGSVIISLSSLMTLSMTTSIRQPNVSWAPVQILSFGCYNVFVSYICSAQLCMIASSFNMLPRHSRRPTVWRRACLSCKFSDSFKD